MENNGWRWAKLAWLFPLAGFSLLVLGNIIFEITRFSQNLQQIIGAIFFYTLPIFYLLTLLLGFIFIVRGFACSKRYKNTIKHAMGGIVVILMSIVIIQSYIKEETRKYCGYKSLKDCVNCP